MMLGAEQFSGCIGDLPMGMDEGPERRRGLQI